MRAVGRGRDQECELWSPEYFRWLFVHQLLRSARGNARGAARDRDPECLLPARGSDDRQGRSARHGHPPRSGVHSHRGPHDHRARRELPARADPRRPSRQATDPGRPSLLHWPEQLAAWGRRHSRRRQHPASLRRQLLHPSVRSRPVGSAPGLCRVLELALTGRRIPGGGIRHRHGRRRRHALRAIRGRSRRGHGSLDGQRSAGAVSGGACPSLLLRRRGAGDLLRHAGVLLCPGGGLQATPAGQRLAAAGGRRAREPSDLVSLALQQARRRALLHDVSAPQCHVASDEVELPAARIPHRRPALSGRSVYGRAGATRGRGPRHGGGECLALWRRRPRSAGRPDPRRRVGGGDQLLRAAGRSGALRVHSPGRPERRRSRRCDPAECGGRGFTAKGRRTDELSPRCPVHRAVRAQPVRARSAPVDLPGHRQRRGLSADGALPQRAHGVGDRSGCSGARCRVSCFFLDW